MIVNNGLKIYVKKNTKIVWNDIEQWAENLCKKIPRLSGMMMNNGLEIYVKKNTLSGMITNNGLKIYVKKNTKIVWNDNEQWAENLCKKEYQDCLK